MRHFLRTAKTAAALFAVGVLAGMTAGAFHALKTHNVSVADHLNFIGNIIGAALGSGLAVWGAVWVEDRKRYNRESNARKLILDAMELVETASERLMESLDAGERQRAEDTVQAQDQLIDSLATLRFAKRRADVADLQLWRALESMEASIARGETLLGREPDGSKHRSIASEIFETDRAKLRQLAVDVSGAAAHVRELVERSS